MKIELSALKTTIVIEKDAIPGLVNALQDSHYSSIVVMHETGNFGTFLDEMRGALSQRSIPLHFMPIPGGEASKTLPIAELCWNSLFKLGADRRTLLISIGGGAFSDLAGFIAHTYMRGIDLMLIPTTLLAMTDASIGGKNALDLAEGKNIVGTFHQPKWIFMTPYFLHTLPERELSSGLAEVIKMAITLDRAVFEDIEKHITQALKYDEDVLMRFVAASCRMKGKIVSEDIYETGSRIVLNFGHTVGHALESFTHYKLLTHGEAVSIGMQVEAQLGIKLGVTPKETAEKLLLLCKRAGLPIAFPKGITLEEVIPFMSHDKKSIGGKIKMAIPTTIGQWQMLKDIQSNQFDGLAPISK